MKNLFFKCRENGIDCLGKRKLRRLRELSIFPVIFPQNCHERKKSFGQEDYIQNIIYVVRVYFRFVHIIYHLVHENE